jgi:hypothetical protein
MLGHDQSKDDAEVAGGLPIGLETGAALDAHTIQKIEAALGVFAEWAMLPSFLDKQLTEPKPDTPARQRAAKRTLRESDAWAIGLILARIAPEPLSLMGLARAIADKDENLQRAARQSLQSRILPAMRDYGLIHCVMNGSGYQIRATERLLVFVKDHYLPSLKHDGWMHYVVSDGEGEKT